MPVLAIGAEKSFGTQQAEVMKLVATNVTAAVIRDSGHWLIEEQPEATVMAIRHFLDGKM
jgi:pimeloyl-ACP methyl ester carboxylesterase